MNSTNFMQQGKIKCPVCNEDKESLRVWQSIDGIPFCVCDKCIKSRLPRNLDAEVDAILKVGFRAGRQSAQKEIMDFLGPLCARI